MSSTVSVSVRENTERERSRSDAAQRRNLVADPANVSRYMDPPADTIYPLEFAFHLLGDVRGKTVVDFGAGDGANSILLAKRGARVISLDLSPELLDICKKRLQINGESAEVLAVSCHDTGLPSDSIDVVFGAAILHHLDLTSAAAEVFRILWRL